MFASQTIEEMLAVSASSSTTPELEKLSKLITPSTYDEYRDALESFDLSSLTHPKRLHMLTRLIEIAVALWESLTDPSGRQTVKDFLEITLQKWSADDDYTAALGDLFSYVACTVATLKNVVDILEEIFPVEIIESQLVQTNGLNLNYVTERVKAVFGPASIGEQEYSYLIEKAGGNERLANFFRRKARATSEHAEVPSWLSIQKSETPALLDFALWKKAETDVDEEAAAPAHGFSKELLASLQEEYAFTRVEGGGVPDHELHKAMEKVVTSTDLSSYKYPGNPSRMFGPINARPEPCISQVIKGSCRMFTCQCREFDQDEDIDPETPIDPESWFTGTCNGCKLKILDLSHALRYPVVGGGWIGCFCSEDCMKTYKPRAEGDDDEMLTDLMFEAISHSGILDRYRLRLSQQPPRLHRPGYSTRPSYSSRSAMQMSPLLEALPVPGAAAPEE